MFGDTSYLCSDWIPYIQPRYAFHKQSVLTDHFSKAITHFRSKKDSRVLDEKWIKDNKATCTDIKGRKGRSVDMFPFVGLAVWFVALSLVGIASRAWVRRHKKKPSDEVRRADCMSSEGGIGGHCMFRQTPTRVPNRFLYTSLD